MNPYIFFFIILISAINCSKLKQTNRISVNTYLISPISNPSVYLTTGEPFIYKSPVPLGSQATVRSEPQLFYINIKKGLIRNFLNGTIFETITLAGGNTRPTIELIYITPYSQNQLELTNPTWIFIRRPGNKVYSITRNVINPITKANEVWAVTYIEDLGYLYADFQLYDPSLITQKWKVA